MLHKKGKEEDFFHYELHTTLHPGDLIEMKDDSILEVIAEMPTRKVEVRIGKGDRLTDQIESATGESHSKQPIGVRIIRRGNLLRAFQRGAILHVPHGYKLEHGGPSHDNVIVTFRPLKLLGPRRRVNVPIAKIISGEHLEAARQNLPWLARLLSRHVPLKRAPRKPIRWR